MSDTYCKSQCRHVIILHAKYQTKWDDLIFNEMKLVLSRSMKSVLLYFLLATLVFRHSNIFKCGKVSNSYSLCFLSSTTIKSHHLIDKFCHIALFSNEYAWLFTVCLENVSLGGSSTVICHYTGTGWLLPTSLEQWIRKRPIPVGASRTLACTNGSLA